LAISSIALTVVLYVFTLGWIIFPAMSIFTDYVAAAIAAFLIILLIIVAFVLVWVQLYYKSIVYHLNDTEMSWKRGV